MLTLRREDLTHLLWYEVVFIYLFFSLLYLFWSEYMTKFTLKCRRIIFKEDKSASLRVSSPPGSSQLDPDNVPYLNSVKERSDLIAKRYPGLHPVLGADLRLTLGI